jgi:hypothetical protein
MANIDPWQKAYEYQKALKRITDPKLRAIFTEFRDLWIALANRKQFLTPAELDTEIEALSNIYNEWVSQRQDAGMARLSGSQPPFATSPSLRPSLPHRHARRMVASS